ncbi:MAG: hypothetical protein OEU78_08175 [Gammaproteobacteria bacterium]|nr:hypothetical protein [Gammaproteobacteria bacterium]
MAIKQNRKPVSTSSLAGIGLVIVGVICGALEKIFYGNRLDANNVLQESFFLPLSIFLTLIGLVVLAFVWGRLLWTKIKKMRA